MASEKQIAANRTNSLSGGVKSNKGKEISRMNAIKHGFFSHIVIESDKVVHKDFCSDIYSAFLPTNAYEAQLVEILLSNLIVYRRVCMVESKLTGKILSKTWSDISMPNIQYESKLEREFIDELTKFQRYKTAAFNLITKAQHELERLKKINKGEDVPLPALLDITVSER